MGGTPSPKIFKAYDIRGIVPDELNEPVARQVARAYAAYTGARRIAFGRDMRTSSPALFEAMADEFVRLGLQVDDIGLIPTEAIYYTAGAFDYDATLTVTASHNPPEYNGMKMMKGKGEVVSGKVIGERIEQGRLAGPRPGGALGTRDVFTPFVEHVLAQVAIEALRPLKVVVDAGNGMAGKVIPALSQKLPFTIVPLFFELDGTFPNRPSNPLLPGALDALRRKVVEERAVCGVAFDGDCDRVFFVDETGAFIQADLTLLLIAEEVLRRKPGQGIVYNAICSRAVREFVTEMGGVPIRTPVGYANVKRGMLEHGGVLGGEVSAHYAFSENYFADSGFIAMLKVLELVSRANEPLSALVGRFRRYVRLDEVNFKVRDAAADLQKIRAFYADAEQDELDGVTVSYPDWWVNVRPSNTEPLLRVTVEGRTRELAEEKQREVLTVLGRA